MSEKTFLNVEKKQSDGSWKVVRTDGHFDTLYVHVLLLFGNLNKRH